MARLLSVLLLALVLSLIRAYQVVVSPLLGSRCRFYPSCSEYARLSVQKLGLLHGLFRALLRLSKCHPLHPGGHDPVVERR